MPIFPPQLLRLLLLHLYLLLLEMSCRIQFEHPAPSVLLLQLKTEIRIKSECKYKYLDESDLYVLALETQRKKKETTPHTGREEIRNWRETDFHSISVDSFLRIQSALLLLL